MVLREHVSEHVYLFQSEVYAQVNAGVIVGSQWAVVVDTLALPEETRAMREFIARELRVPVRYVVLTHYHADHSWGAYFFPGALVVAHTVCRHLLATRGREALAQVQAQEPAYQRIKLVLPHITFSQGHIRIHLEGRVTLRLFPLPGHSDDGIGVYVEEDRVLFAGDAFMPLPTFIEGDVDKLVHSLKAIAKLPLENLIPGHGPVVLRGEIQEAIKSNLKYISQVRKYVRYSARRRYPGDYLSRVTVDKCGKSPALLGGIAPQLHRRNIWEFFRRRFGTYPRTSDEDADEGQP